MNETKIKAKGRISLAEKCPELVKEWDYDKNEEGPEEYIYGSHKKVWWKCDLGHNWEATITNRARGRGCHICSGRKVLTGFNDLATKNPVLASEWHPTKNKDLSPSEVAPGSDKKVWWQCNLGHEWEAIINSRARGNGCPICSGRQVLAGFNDLATKNPVLASEWHPTKNSDLLPSEVAPGSTKKVWWQCELGHNWEATICNRARGSGCPICSGRQVLAGFNDLVTKNPVLASQWHPTKNNNLSPSEVAPGSDKKVWWQCNLGHNWEATISNRVIGSGCPICSGQKVLTGFNDLATKNPVLASEWHPTKNKDLLPSDVVLNSSKKVWWQCDLGHEWKAVIYGRTRTRGSGCPICNEFNKTSFPEKIIFYYIKQIFKNAIVNCYPDWLDGKEIDIYIPEIDLSIEYDGFRWHILKRDSEKNKIFKKLRKKILRVREPGLPKLNDNSVCFEISKVDSDYNYMNAEISKIVSYINENYNMSIKLDINIKRDYSEICNLIELKKINNSLAITHPELANDWNYEKNGKLKPEHVTYGSNKRINWKCFKCGNEWISNINNRTNGRGCPECGKKKKIISRRENNLKKMQYINPNLESGVKTERTA